MAFAIKRRTPLPTPLMALISIHFFTPLFYFAIESYIYETDFTLWIFGQNPKEQQLFFRDAFPYLFITWRAGNFLQCGQKTQSQICKTAATTILKPILLMMNYVGLNDHCS